MNPHHTFRFVLIVNLMFTTARVSLAADAPFQPPAMHVPPGYTVELAAAPPLVEHPMMAGFDDHGRLYIAESAGLNLNRADLEKKLPNFVRTIEDTNGDGVFDKSTIFADNMTFPMGALWHNGSVYVASSGAVWRLQDTDGDGVADKRQKLVGDFGYTGNAADVHGCFLGPDGRIWWVEGRHGHEIKDKDGNVTSKGKGARIFSCNPDGSDVRVFCGGGMDNPIEIVFTPEGDVLGTVNLFYGRPRGDCLVHWVYGGVYPRRDQEAVIAEFKRTGDLLPEVHNFGHVALSGLCLYRSDHLVPRPGKGRHVLFLTQFNTHKIVRVEIEQFGSTYRTTKIEDFLTCDSPDFHPTDVLEDADGSLLVIDTGGWFRIGCPVSQVAKPDIRGAIYRIRRTDRPRATVAHVTKAPDAVVNTPTPAALIKQLTDASPAQRRRAAAMLAQIKHRAAVPALLAALGAPENDRMLDHAITYALIEIGDAGATAKGLAYGNPAVRRGAAIALSEMKRADPAAAGIVPIDLPDPVTATPPSSEQQARVLSLSGELREGDAQRGRAVFTSEKTKCAACHRVGSQGGLVGPDLSTIGRIRTRRDLLESIVLPSASIARGYEPYIFEIDDGQQLGVVTREGVNDIELVTGPDKTVTIQRKAIRQVRASPLSVMPNGLDQGLSTMELSDLLAYLISLK